MWRCVCVCLWNFTRLDNHRSRAGCCSECALANIIKIPRWYANISRRESKVIILMSFRGCAFRAKIKRGASLVGGGGGDNLFSSSANIFPDSSSSLAHTELLHCGWQFQLIDILRIFCRSLSLAAFVTPAGFFLLVLFVFDLNIVTIKWNISRSFVLLL